VTARSIALFVAAAIVEIGGAYLVWIGIKDHRGVAFVALGAMALTAYGVIAALRPSHEFGRVLAAYGGVFIVGSLLWASPLLPRPLARRGVLRDFGGPPNRPA
jgi:small multidrug resistance family-3 protein